MGLRKENFMDEMKLINMMSFLDPEVLENDYIEDDLRGINPVAKNIILLVAGIATMAGVISLIVKKNKNPEVTFNKLKLPTMIIKLVTN